MIKNSEPFVCANVECRAKLERDHVTLITTLHVRRFCSVECIADGQRAHHDAISAMSWEEVAGFTGDATPVVPQENFWSSTHTGVLHGLLLTEQHFEPVARPQFLLSIRNELHRRGADVAPPPDLDLGREWGDVGSPCLDRCTVCNRGGAA